MKRTALYVGTIVVVALVTAGVMLLGQNVMERRAEGERAVFNVVDLDETVVDPEIWGENFPRQFDGYERTVDSHVKNLRAKLGDDPRDPTFIWTVHGVGYRFEAPKAADAG